MIRGQTKAIVFPYRWRASVLVVGDHSARDFRIGMHAGRWITADMRSWAERLRVGWSSRSDQL